jgi:hypothetical protein
MISTPRISLPRHRANFTEAGSQGSVEVADIGSGRYIVIWTESDGGPIATSPGADIVGQIFDAAGNRFGSEFKVNSSFPVSDYTQAALDARPGGGFVMVYNSGLGVGVGNSIRVQTRDVNGTLVGGTPVTIQAPDGDSYGSATVAVRPNGSYLVAYERLVSVPGSHEVPPIDIVGHVVSAAGVVGSEFTIGHAGRVGGRPDADVLTSGSDVIVWERPKDLTRPYDSDSDPWFQIRTPLGFSVTGALDSSTHAQFQVEVAALTGGGFVAAWTETDVDGSGMGIRARVYNDLGRAAGSAFTVNVSVAGNQSACDIAALGDGGFVVTWLNDESDIVQGRRFDATGHGVGEQFTAGDLFAFNQAVASLHDGRFVVAVTSREVETTTFAIDTQKNDFNFDMRSDILWRHDGDGTVRLWDMSGSTSLGGHTFTGTGPDWHLQGTADFNFDGSTDLLWRHDDGRVATWHMRGGEVLSTQFLPTQPRDWHIVGTGDFNGDDKGDILWLQDSGQVGVWRMNGATVLSTAVVGTQAPGWHIDGTGDFNGDGRDEILFRHDSTGLVATWHITDAGTHTLGGLFDEAPPDWHVQGVGDFNGDGRDDILWRNDAGLVGTWHMNAAAAPETQVFSTEPASWHIDGVGDFNADGKDDILWRNDFGTTGVWFMDGDHILSQPVVGRMPTDWHILNAHFEVL